MKLKLRSLWNSEKNKFWKCLSALQNAEDQDINKNAICFFMWHEKSHSESGQKNYLFINLCFESN
jgi:hypothetical protein